MQINTIHLIAWCSALAAIAIVAIVAILAQ